MFSIGDTVFYESHGVCTIVDIQERTFSKTSADYYILRPLQNETLTLYHPVGKEQSKLTTIASKEKAKLILETFKSKPDGVWDDHVTKRSQQFKAILESNDHIQVAKMINTLLRKKAELEHDEKKLHSQDAQLLSRLLPNLYDELAVSLNVTPEEVKKRIQQAILAS